MPLALSIAGSFSAFSFPGASLLVPSAPLDPTHTPHSTHRASVLSEALLSGRPAPWLRAAAA
eukprot:6199942-Pleurochrysis_carterae.AAC.1